MKEQEILDELEHRLHHNMVASVDLGLDHYDRAQNDQAFVQMAALLISMRRDMGVGDET